MNPIECSTIDCILYKYIKVDEKLFSKNHSIWYDREIYEKEANNYRLWQILYSSKTSSNDDEVKSDYAKAIQFEVLYYFEENISKFTIILEWIVIKTTLKHMILSNISKFGYLSLKLNCYLHIILY